MVRQQREAAVIGEQRRIMGSSVAPSPSSSVTTTSKTNSSDSNSISPSPSSQNSATLSTQSNTYHATTPTSSSSSPPPPAKSPPPSSPPPSSPPPPRSSPPPPTAKSNPTPKTSPSPPPPSPESESPPPESSESPPPTKSPPESSQSDSEPSPPPPQSGSMQMQSLSSTSGFYSPQPPSTSTSPPPPGKSPSSTTYSPPTSSNDSAPPPSIGSTASLFSQSATDATSQNMKSPSKSLSPTTSGNGTSSSSSTPSSSSSSSSTPSSSSSSSSSSSTPSSSSSSSTPSSSSSTTTTTTNPSSSSNETSNSALPSSSRNETSSPSNETSNSNSTSTPTPTSSSGSASASPSSSHSGAVGGAIVGAVAGVLIILLLGILFLFIKRKRKRVGPYSNSYHPPPSFTVPPDQSNYYRQTMVFSGEYGYAPNSFGSQQGGTIYHGGSGPEIGGSKFYSYEELMEMTNGFSRQNIIGEGGFGCVFRAQLHDGRFVAVKQLKAGSGQGEREFRAEVEIISRVHHRHLVSLVGYCIAEHRRLLIYEFVPNKTLEHHLHGNAMPVLEWTKRLKIALGSAKGLAYLHEDCHPKIIHRDIKSANILLDDAFEAQVADFGLAKLTNDANTHVSTRVMGTFGYLAPEYASSGKLTDRSDVFSFGVVLLELLTGRKPVDSSQPLGDESLVEWARPRLVIALESGDFSELVDPRLGKSYVESELVRMMEAAAACIRHSAPKRPRMAQVVRALDCDEELSDLSNGVKYGQSTMYNSNQYSQDIMKFRRMAAGDDDSMEYESTASKPLSNNNQTSW